VNSDVVWRYKELAERNTAAVTAMREHDRAVAQRLTQRLDSAERALAEATERERVAKISVRMHWESATELLWEEKWLNVGPPPEPMVPTPGLDMLGADSALGRTYEILRDALRKTPLLPFRSREE
jgi:hypothetical protein